MLLSKFATNPLIVLQLYYYLHVATKEHRLWFLFLSAKKSVSVWTKEYVSTHRSLCRRTGRLGCSYDDTIEWTMVTKEYMLVRVSRIELASQVPVKHPNQLN